MISQPSIRKAVYFLLGLGALIAVAVVYFDGTFDRPNACKSAAEGKVAVRASGLSWDADSSGFAFIQGLSAEEGAKKAGRLNSRVYVDGQPERFAITETGPEFQIEFETDQPMFRLIVEGDRFPRTISQPYTVPEKGCDIDVERLNAPRGEGPEHTWPLPIVATEMGYGSWNDLMDDNNAVIRVLTYGSGEEGITDAATNSFLEIDGTDIAIYNFNMDKEITFLEEKDENIGAFIVVVPFSADSPPNKEFSVTVRDTVTEETWNPPRPWKFDPVKVFVRNGFATDIRVAPSPDQ
jgi:hypothetical protein